MPVFPRTGIFTHIYHTHQPNLRVKLPFSMNPTVRNKKPLPEISGETFWRKNFPVTPRLQEIMCQKISTTLRPWKVVVYGVVVELSLLWWSMWPSQASALRRVGVKIRLVTAKQADQPNVFGHYICGRKEMKSKLVFWWFGWVRKSLEKERQKKSLLWDGPAPFLRLYAVIHLTPTPCFFWREFWLLVLLFGGRKVV